MNEATLRLGRMDGHEIAEWLRISYNTYKRNVTKHLEKLEDFCKFKRIRGGVEIEEIWCKYYHKDFVVETHAKILAEIKRNPINTIVNLAHSTGFTQYQVSKTCNYCFGKMSRTSKTASGIMGMRSRSWGIKLADGNYRLLSEEELKLFKQYARDHFDWVEEMGNAIDTCEEGDIYDKANELERLKMSFYENVISRLEDNIGHRIIRVTIFEFAHQFTLIGEDKEAADILEAELNKLGIYFERR